MTHFSKQICRIAIFAIGSIGVHDTANGQASAKCRAADGRSASMISDIKRYLAATDPKMIHNRDNVMHLPVVSSSQVSLVTDEKVCAKAVQAYGTVPNAYTPTKLFVVKMGNKGYVTYDPDRKAGEFSVVFVFDTKYVRTGGWVGG